MANGPVEYHPKGLKLGSKFFAQFSYGKLIYLYLSVCHTPCIPVDS